MPTHLRPGGGGRSWRYPERVTEPGDAPPEAPQEESPDDVTVGAWLDVDPPPEEQSLVREPSEQQPGLWARIVRALRGRS
jgi:hypothetical protein